MKLSHSVKGMYDINKESFAIMCDSHRRGHDQKLFKTRFSLDVRKFAFTNRVVDNWNLEFVVATMCKLLYSEYL